MLSPQTTTDAADRASGLGRASHRAAVSGSRRGREGRGQERPDTLLHRLLSNGDLGDPPPVGGGICVER
ncbi:unnamed protein product [Ectocarpus sp. CCAP 1310/34]|nr:unnamed protein product [Ectocarpus sp. CCAP 1310/34]